MKIENVKFDKSEYEYGVDKVAKLSFDIFTDEKDVELVVKDIYKIKFFVYSSDGGGRIIKTEYKKEIWRESFLFPVSKKLELEIPLLFFNYQDNLHNKITIVLKKGFFDKVEFSILVPVVYGTFPDVLNVSPDFLDTYLKRNTVKLDKNASICLNLMMNLDSVPFSFLRKFIKKYCTTFVSKKDLGNYKWISFYEVFGGFFLIIFLVLAFLPDLEILFMFLYLRVAWLMIKITSIKIKIFEDNFFIGLNNNLGGKFLARKKFTLSDLLKEYKISNVFANTPGQIIVYLDISLLFKCNKNCGRIYNLTNLVLLNTQFTTLSPSHISINLPPTFYKTLCKKKFIFRREISISTLYTLNVKIILSNGFIKSFYVSLPLDCN